MRRILHIARLLTLPCSEVARLASLSLDRPLSRGERLALWSHLVYCKACRRYRRQILRLRETLRMLREPIESPAGLAGAELTMPTELRERLRKVIEDGDPAS